MSSHRQAVESILGNKRDQFQKEHEEDIEDLDALLPDDGFKKDNQYKELLGSAHGLKKKIGFKPLEELPKYKGQKVSRKQLQQEEESEDNIDEDNEVEEDGDDDDVDEEELILSDSEIESSDEQKDKEQDSQEEEDELVAMDEEDAQFTQLKKMTKTIVESKKNKKYLQDEMNVDEIIDEIDQQDKGTSGSVKQSEDELEKAKSVRQQISIWKELVFVRFGLQNTLELLKKYPSVNDISGFETKENNKGLKFLEFGVLKNLDQLSKIRGNLLKKASGNTLGKSTKSNIKLIRKFIEKNKIDRNSYENEQSVNVEHLWQSFDNQFEETKPWVEENILKWSQKTQLLNSLNLKRSGMGALVHTPIGQTQKAMQQFDNLVFKSQLKRNSFRILGKDISNVQRETDPEIYDDSDLYHELLKEYMTEIEQNKEVGEDGLLFDSTRLYLLERKLKQQEKKQKTVDRKSSKNRKIRFDVHQKLVNFMNPIENKELLEGRSEIIKCLLGKTVEEDDQEEQQQKEDQKSQDQNLTKNKKDSSKSAKRAHKELPNEEDQGFELI